MPNDPRQHRPERGPGPSRAALPCALSSLVLWLALWVALPAWLIGALVAGLLVGCAAGAAAPRLQALGPSRGRARTGRLA